MSDAVWYALLAASGNVLGAVAVVRHAARSLTIIEHSVAFSAGFMLALAFVDLWPEAMLRSGPVAPVLVLVGYLLVHLTQHALTPHFHFGEETHAVHALAGGSALAGLLLHTFFDGVAIASGFLVSAQLGLLVFAAILLHKLPEGVTIASLCVASGWSAGRSIRAAALLGLATVVGVFVTGQGGLLWAHGLALSAGVTIYVAASNLVPEFQGKGGWRLPAAFFTGTGVFFVTRLALDSIS